jgi:hypothetical protein
MHHVRLSRTEFMLDFQIPNEHFLLKEYMSVCINTYTYAHQRIPSELAPFILCNPLDVLSANDDEGESQELKVKKSFLLSIIQSGRSVQLYSSPHTHKKDKNKTSARRYASIHMCNTIYMVYAQQPNCSFPYILLPSSTARQGEYTNIRSLQFTTTVTTLYYSTNV